MDKLVFVAYILVILVALFVFACWKSGKGVRYMRTDEGKGAIKSALLFVLILGLPVLLFGCSSNPDVKYFDYARIYMGVDHTKKLSPQCEDTGPSNRLTSNGGFELGLISYGRFDSYFKYTHHSCAISPDDKSFDAGGFGANWWLKGR